MSLFLENINVVKIHTLYDSDIYYQIIYVKQQNKFYSFSIIRKSIVHDAKPASAGIEMGYETTTIS